MIAYSRPGDWKYMTRGYFGLRRASSARAFFGMLRILVSRSGPAGALGLDLADLPHRWNVGASASYKSASTGRAGSAAAGEAWRLRNGESETPRKTLARTRSTHWRTARCSRFVVVEPGMGAGPMRWHRYWVRFGGGSPRDGAGSLGAWGPLSFSVRNGPDVCWNEKWWSRAPSRTRTVPLGGNPRRRDGGCGNGRGGPERKQRTTEEGHRMAIAAKS